MHYKQSKRKQPFLSFYIIHFRVTCMPYIYLLPTISTSYTYTIILLRRVSAIENNHPQEYDFKQEV
jgi:hypothetical protein